VSKYVFSIQGLKIYIRLTTGIFSNTYRVNGKSAVSGANTGEDFIIIPF
jgi:hypothetical protein